MKSKIPFIRKKRLIKVLFVVSEVNSWKSELLYLKMINHNRFDPVIGVSSIVSNPKAKDELFDYFIRKGYNYKDLDNPKETIDIINPDLIFYYKPYETCYSKGHFFNHNLKYVFCGLDYGMAITKHAIHIEKAMFDYCWQFYVENEEVAKRKREVCGYKARNVVITGVPMQDVLLQPQSFFDDPWKDSTGKKRIIYAPHHSFKGTNADGIEFATFLDFGEDILRLAKKYCNQITIAFKPHPNLYKKLLSIWGKERTDEYYHEWESMQNTQLETGEYVGLFKHSDAIIHDCASFIVEYLYMDNPSLYLVAKTNNMSEMFDFVREGFECYEHGRSVEEIESFIINVIEGFDNKKDSRRAFLKRRLLPPNGKSACDNIIESILG